MKAARNIGIILLIALVIDVVPGGGNFADGLLAVISLVFLAVIGIAALQLYHRYRLTYFGLAERQRAMLLGGIGAIVLMIAGADEMTDTGAGLFIWLAVLGAAIYSILRVYTESQSY